MISTPLKISRATFPGRRRLGAHLFLPHQFRPALRAGAGVIEHLGVARHRAGRADVPGGFLGGRAGRLPAHRPRRPDLTGAASRPDVRPRNDGEQEAGTGDDRHGTRQELFHLTLLVNRFPITGRRDSDDAQEGAPHRFGASEAAAPADFLEAVRGVLQETAGGIDAGRNDEAGRSRADLAREDTGEIARAHRRAPGQRLDRQIGARVLEDVRLQIAQRLALGELQPPAGR